MTYWAISTLTNLLNAGVTQAEILEATRFYEWTKQWQSQDNNGHNAAAGNGGKTFRLKLDEKSVLSSSLSTPLKHFLHNCIWYITTDFKYCINCKIR
jgi:hypothetical protein